MQKNKLNVILVLIILILLIQPNIICAQYGTLKIKWAGVIDNGEGDDWPHGITGSMHILIYPISKGCPGNRKSYKGSGYYGRDMMLPGPTSGDYWYDLEDVGLSKLGSGDADREWLDGDEMKMNLSIYKWKSVNEHVIVAIYESDPGGAGRSHDLMFCYGVNRQSTLNNKLVLGDTYRLAKDDALSNCKKRRIVWHRKVWRNGLSRGIPSMFLQVTTE